MPQTHIDALSLRSRPGFFAGVLSYVTLAFARRRERQRLGQLDAHLLRDIGLDAQGRAERVRQTVLAALTASFPERSRSYP